MTKRVRDLGPDDIGKVVVFNTGHGDPTKITGTLEQIKVPSVFYDEPSLKIAGENHLVTLSTEVWVDGYDVSYDSYLELQQLEKKVKTT